jgi:hypothetical protein
MKIGTLFFIVVFFTLSIVALGQLPDDDCIDRLVDYDIQLDERISEFQVLVDSVEGGNVKLRVFPRKVAGYRSPISANAIESIQKGQTIQDIYKRDRSVRLLVDFERKVRKIPGVSSVSWLADASCKPGYSCSVSQFYLTPSHVAPCLAYRTGTKVPIRRSTNVLGAINEGLKLLERGKVDVFLGNYVVTGARKRVPSVEIEKAIVSLRQPEIKSAAASLRQPNSSVGLCPDKSQLDHLVSQLKVAKGMQPRWLTVDELIQFGFRQPDFGFSWAYFKFPEPECQHSYRSLYFVEIGKYWYLRL